MSSNSFFNSPLPETVAIPFAGSEPASGSWRDPLREGQLALDVLETAQDVAIVATLAGTKPEDISLHLHKDVLTIRGIRRRPVAEVSGVFYEECYWGPFSRTIVLPVDVEQESARAEYRAGVLTVLLQKSSPQGDIPLMVIEE